MEDSFRSILEDPLTLELMVDAAVAPCGHSFSKASIERWVQGEGKRFCPLCKRALTAEDLRPNYSLRDAVNKYVEEHGERSADEKRGLDIHKPMEDWTVADTKLWIEKHFADWVEDSALVDEHRIDGNAIASMSEEQLQEKLNVPAEKAKLLYVQIRKAAAISKCLVDYAVFPSLVGTIDGTSSAEVTYTSSSYQASSSSTSTNFAVESGMHLRQSDFVDRNSNVVNEPPNDEEEGAGGCARWLHEAQESETGCCLFACEGCFLCDCSEGWYECCHYKMYHAPAALFCEHCGGKKATYGRRTFWGIFFIPFVMIVALLLFVEAAFWMLLIIIILALVICVLAVCILGAGGSRRRR